LLDEIRYVIDAFQVLVPDDRHFYFGGSGAHGAVGCSPLFVRRNLRSLPQLVKIRSGLMNEFAA
jgi:hypothetical protein